MQVLRTAMFITLTVVTSLVAACFGDNGGDGGSSSTPSIVNLSAPDVADAEDPIDVEIKVKGEPNGQLSVAVDSALGVFSPQNKVVITDDRGEATFLTRYTPGAVAGVDTLTANVSSAQHGGRSATKEVTIYAAERVEQFKVRPTVPSAEQADYLIAYPITIASSRVLRGLGIYAPEPAKVRVGLYSNKVVPVTLLNSPDQALARLEATLVAGANDLAIPKQPVEPGIYWMVVTYEGTPRVFREAATRDGWTRTLYPYTSGLPDVLTGMTAITTLGTRAFYIVLRK